MIPDKQNTFSENQAVTVTAASTNVIDLQAGRDLAAGTPVRLHIQVTEDFATLTSLTVTVEGDTVENFASATTLASSGVIPVASLKAGYVFPLTFVPATSEQYLRLYYTVSGTTATAGKVTAFLADEVQSNHI